MLISWPLASFIFLFLVVSKDTFILLAWHPFGITLSSDALVSKNAFFGRTTFVQDLEVDIPCDKHHINQHQDTVYTQRPVPT